VANHALMDSKMFCNSITYGTKKALLGRARRSVEQEYTNDIVIRTTTIVHAVPKLPKHKVRTVFNKHPTRVFHPAVDMFFHDSTSIHVKALAGYYSTNDSSH
jgi:hypothetical protein